MSRSDISSQFGEVLKLSSFNLDKSITFCNHGSYGTVPKVVFAKKQNLQLEIESAPDKWFRYTSWDQWNHNKQLLADYLKVNTDNLLICDNATESINAALKSIEFNGSQDAILETEYTYKAIANTVDYVSRYRFTDSNQVQVFKVPCIFPIKSKEQIIQEFREQCEYIINVKKLRLRVVLIDHISSASAILYPIKELIQVIRSLTKNMDTLIMIDGAHSIGQIDIDLKSLDCDYYISNLHKWFLAPRGCSFLYLKDPVKLGKDLQPNYISHGYDKDLNYNFYRRGTADKSSFFCIGECIKFYEENLGGLSTIRNYTSIILKKAVEMLLQAWNTTALDISPDLEAPYMKMIKLPYMKNYEVRCDADADQALTKLLKDLYDKHKIISCVVYVDKSLWIRISCYVYNELKDFERLRDAILDLQKD